MEMRALELKSLKRAYIREKRRFVTAWKTLTLVALALALVFTPLALAAKVFDNTIAPYLGGTFWKITGEDPAKVRFAVDYATREQLKTAAQTAQKQAALEGTVLLKNEGVLPLAKGADVCWMMAVKRPEITENAGFDNVAATEGTGEFHADVGVVVLTGADGELEVLASALQEKTAGRVEKLIALLGGVQIPDLTGFDGVIWQGVLDYEAAGKVLSGEVSPSGRLPFTYSKLAAPQNGGIYADYKYFETRYEDAMLGAGNVGAYTYDAAVVYPFGYGLSYTTFQYENFAVAYNPLSDVYDVTLTVTNSGGLAGREVVQIYAQAPYTDYDREIAVEKAAVNLVGFAKTKLLQPGESEAVAIAVKGQDLASFDGGAYILDAGMYYLTAAANSHAAANNILTAKGIAAGGDTAFVYSWERAEFTTLRTVTAKQENAACLSRQDWTGTENVTAPENTFTPYSPGDYPTVAMPTLGAQNALKLYDLVGVPLADSRWQTLLDQLTFDDMVRILADGEHFRLPAESVQAPGAREGAYSEELFKGSRVLAASFDTALAGEVGKVLGNTALYDGFVYLRCDGSSYSPDGFLGGKICAAQMAAVGAKGVNVVLSGFDAPWHNAQAVREQYLRVLRYAIPEGKVQNVAFTAPVTKAMTELLREEWGALGVRLDGDFRDSGAAGVMAGVSGYTGAVPYMVAELAGYENDPVVVTAMRQACHYELYALANSAAMNGIGPDTRIDAVQHWSVTVCAVAALVSWIGLIVFALLWGAGRKKWKKTEGYLNYKTLKTVIREEKKVK